MRREEAIPLTKMNTFDSRFIFVRAFLGIKFKENSSHRLLTEGAHFPCVATSHDFTQWRNAAPGAPATPGGAAHRGRQIVVQMWDNFARLTARLAKMRVFFNNFAIF